MVKFNYSGISNVKGGEKVYHCGGGIVYHRHDEKGLNWEPGGIRSGAGVRSSGVSQESTGSSDTWDAMARKFADRCCAPGRQAFSRNGEGAG